jgi:ABC-type sugar transport system substrate-binding protein
MTAVSCCRPASTRLEHTVSATTLLRVATAGSTVVCPAQATTRVIHIHMFLTNVFFHICIDWLDTQVGAYIVKYFITSTNIY